MVRGKTSLAWTEWVKTEAIDLKTVHLLVVIFSLHLKDHKRKSNRYCLLGSNHHNPVEKNFQRKVHTCELKSSPVETAKPVLDVLDSDPAARYYKH